MPDDASKNSSMLTTNRVLTAVILVLLGAAGFLIVRYVDGYIPKMIETEVSKQLRADVKAQIAEEIDKSVSSQIKSGNEALGKKIDEQNKYFEEQNKYFNDKIIGIYEMVSQKQQTLVPSLKRGTRRNNHAMLMKTLPITRELLAHAKSKALSTPEEAPEVTPRDFKEISRSLFFNYRDPSLSPESWSTLLELTSYKTVVNGIEFGVPKSSGNYASVVSLDDRELRNEVIFNSTILLGRCQVTLRNVRFVNCTFDVERGINGESLLKAIVESDKPTISLRLGSPPGYVKGSCEK